MNAKRGRPPKGDAKLTQAERSKRARQRRAQERANRTRGLAHALALLTVDHTDEAGDDLIAGLAAALIGVSLDMHTGSGDLGEDSAIRSAVRALADAIAQEMDCEQSAGLGAISQALHELAR